MNVTLENRVETPGRVCAKMLGISGLPSDGWLRCKFLKRPGSWAFQVSFLASSKRAAESDHETIHMQSLISATSEILLSADLENFWRKSEDALEILK